MVKRNIKNKIYKKENDINLYRIKKKLKEINFQIKKGILNIKKEEQKNNIIKEKRNNLFKNLKNEATKEVKSILNDPIFKIPLFNPSNQKYFMEEYKNYAHYKRKENYMKNELHHCSSLNHKKIINIDFSSNSLTYRKKLPKIPLIGLIKSKQKYKNKINKHKSLGAIETERSTSLLSSINRLKSQNNLVNNEKKDKNKDGEKIDKEKNERKIIVLLTNKIKKLYEQKKNKNTIFK